MIADIWTVAWKELRGLLYANASLARGLRPLLFSLAVFGVFLPLQMGHGLVDSPAALLPWVWVPFLMVNGVVADAFAGERERHTLETLLVTRLPDRAIFLGKVLAAIVYGFGFALVSALLGVVVVNVAEGEGRPLFYPPQVLAVLVAFGLLGSACIAGVGTLVSMRAATVRQASQTVSIALFAVVLAPVLFVNVVPAEWRASLDRTIQQIGLVETAVAVAAALAALDAVLLLIGMARFRRDRLALD